MAKFIPPNTEALPVPAHGDQELATFHIYKCPQKLIDRAGAKAALKGKGVSEWVIQVLERETKDLVEIQERYLKEEKETSDTPAKKLQ